MLPDLPPTELQALFRRMLLVRRRDEQLILLATSGLSFGHYHAHIGRETIGLRELRALRPTGLGTMPGRRRQGVKGIRPRFPLGGKLRQIRREKGRR